MALLKALVVIMGVLIIAGTTLLVTLLVTGAGRSKPPTPAVAGGPPPAPAAAAGAALAGFETARIPLPSGARIASVSASGERAILHLVDSAGLERLLIVDLATGRQLGLVELAPTP